MAAVPGTSYAEAREALRLSTRDWAAICDRAGLPYTVEAEYLLDPLGNFLGLANQVIGIGNVLRAISGRQPSRSGTYWPGRDKASMPTSRRPRRGSTPRPRPPARPSSAAPSAARHRQQ